jgi:hypothetical protein
MADRSALPPDLPDDHSPEPPEARGDNSLMEDIDALIADGKTYLEAELAYQKSRAGFTANRLKWSVAYGAAAFAFLHLALIALTVGAVFALSPVTGPWLATGIVVVVLLALAGFFLLRLRGKVDDVRSVFDNGEP